MPRYFFDFFDDSAAHDEEGVELEDAAAARALALKYAKELAAEDAAQGQANPKSFIRVRDDKCWALFEVRFADVEREPVSRATDPQLSKHRVA